MSKLPKYKAPFYKGSLQHYVWPPDFAHLEYGNEGEEWRDNVPFTATLECTGMESGYSAKYTWWKDEEGHRYPMFVADIVHLVQNADITGGKVWDTQWIVRKRGQNYGIRIYEGE